MKRIYPKTSGYWVYAHVTPNGMYYIGMSKIQPSERWRKSNYKTSALVPHIEQYGWENIQHKVLIDGLTKEQAEAWEDRLIVALSMNGLCINKHRSGGLRRDNKKAYKKQYDEEHKEEIKAYNNQYYKDNKEEIKAHQKRYDEDHKEEKKAYYKQRYSTPEGKIYYRVQSYNRNHTPIETPMMAKLNYIMLGIVPWYIKNDDLTEKN